MFGCVRDVKTESAADFRLASGQTWDWVPHEVETWQDYKRDARQARINVHDAYAEQRHEGRTEWGDGWDNYAEDTLVIDIVDPSSGQLLWSGSGVGNTRGMGDDSDRMRGVKEAVRHIMRDLE